MKLKDLSALLAKKKSNFDKKIHYPMPVKSDNSFF